MLYGFLHDLVGKKGFLIHVNPLSADDSHKISNIKSYFDFLKQGQNLKMSSANVWCFKGKDALMMKYVSPRR